MRTVTPTEAKILRKILLSHNAGTLSPDCDDHPKLNLILDHLRGMLMDIGDRKLQAQNDAIKAVGNISHEDQKREAIKRG